MPVDLRWRDDFNGAAIIRDGHFIGTFRIEEWWEQPWGDPTPAWVASLFDSASGRSTRLCVERPARRMNAARADEALGALRQAVARGHVREHIDRERTPPDARRALDRMLMAWVDAFDRLWAAAVPRDPDRAGSILVALAEVLNWAYTIDQALQALWRDAPDETRRVMSDRVDMEIGAARAVADQQRGAPSSDAETLVNQQHVRRQQARVPYEHWSSLLAAGQFHAGFFDGVNWVGGKVRHGHVVELPIELRQRAPGEEPRWKWKNADAIARGHSDKSRARYVEHIQDNDVLGMFSWFIEVYVEAGHVLVPLARGPHDSSG